MKYIIEVVISNDMHERLGEGYVQNRIDEESKQLIGEKLFKGLLFFEKQEHFHKVYSSEIYTLTQGQVDFIEAMLSLTPKIKSQIMNEILNK